MIRPAVQAGLAGAPPVLAEPMIDEVTALAGLDVGEGDPVAGNLRPVDVILVGRDVDAVLLTFSQWRPPARHPEEPPRGDERCEHDDHAADNERPSVSASSSRVGIGIHEQKRGRSRRWAKHDTAPEGGYGAQRPSLVILPASVWRLCSTARTMARATSR